MDFSANARLQNGLLLQGGFSTGRTVTDNCDVIGNSQGVVFSATAGPSPRVPRRSGVPHAVQVPDDLYDSASRPDLATTIQSTPGPVITPIASTPMRRSALTWSAALRWRGEHHHQPARAR